MFFLENPVTNDEQVLASLLGNIFYGLKNQNWNMLASAFSETANIHSLAARGKIVSKKIYIETLKRRSEDNTLKIEPVSFKDILIRVVSNERAIASAVLVYRINSIILSPRKLSYEFTKEKSMWKISEQLYL